LRETKIPTQGDIIDR